MKNIYQPLLNLIQKSQNKLIIVEGQKDKKALQSLGFKKIITLKKPLYQVAEETAQKEKEVLLLVDLDKEGKKLYAKLSQDLTKLGLKINNQLRHFLFKNTKLRQIEGLPRYLDKQKSKINIVP